MRYALLPLALICAVCPLCIAKRAYPESGYARAADKIERYCPFCWSYFKVFVEPKKLTGS